MNIKTKMLAGLAAMLIAFSGWRHFSYVPGYCPASKHLITDIELVKTAIRLFDEEVASSGGFDSIEKDFARINRPLREAGRSFDRDDPQCCTVFRGFSEVKKNCGLSDYPLCVLLNFPRLKDDITPNYGWEGRSAFFDDCGKVKWYF